MLQMNLDANIENGHVDIGRRGGWVNCKIRIGIYIFTLVFAE